MKESRRFRISNKLINRKNIIKIAEIITNEYQNSYKQKRHSSVLFSIICKDSTAYESDSISVFDENGITDIKKAEKVEFTYYDHDLNRHILIVLAEGNNSYGQISGSDSKWVSVTFMKLNEYVDSIRPQEKGIFKHKELIRHLFALLSGKLLFSIMYAGLDFLIGPIQIQNPSEGLLQFASFLKSNEVFTELLVYWIIPWLWGLSLSRILLGYIVELWPDVEFDFGQEHLKSYKKRRARMNYILTIIVIPSVLMIIYDVVKGIIS